MAQYINKDDLVEAIERLKNELNPNFYEYDYDAAKVELLDQIANLINTFEMKSVDLDKEIETHLKNCLDVKFPTTDIELIKKDVTYTGKKFFEFGLKTRIENNVTDKEKILTEIERCETICDNFIMTHPKSIDAHSKKSICHYLKNFIQSL